MAKLSHAEIGRRIATLKSRFVTHDGYMALAEQFERLLQRRRAEIAAGIAGEQRGIVIVGRSGSGKTTAIDRLVTRHSDIQLPSEQDDRADVVSLRVPSPATLKFVGYTALTALGYPLKRERTGAFIWDQVRFHLRERQTLFLHLDEAQDIHAKTNERETQSVVNTLKSIMQNKDWPVGILLSGMPELKNLLNVDSQLARRFFPIEFKPLSAIVDTQEVIGICKVYCKTASLRCDKALLKREFAARLIHAAGHEFGLVIEIIVGAVEEALVGGDNRLETRHFTDAFRRRSGCIDGLNPFIADDFERIDCRELFAEEDFDDPTTI